MKEVVGSLIVLVDDVPLLSEREQSHVRPFIFAHPEHCGSPSNEADSIYRRNRIIGNRQIHFLRLSSSRELNVFQVGAIADIAMTLINVGIN